MSFVVTVPDLLSAAAGRLQVIGSTIGVANATAAFPITGVLPAAADEVSAAAAAAFSGYGQAYQAISAEAALIHEEFVGALRLGAHSYAATEASNATQAAGGHVPAAPDRMAPAPARPAMPARMAPTAPGAPARPATPRTPTRQVPAGPVTPAPAGRTPYGGGYGGARVDPYGRGGYGGHADPYARFSYGGHPAPYGGGYSGHPAPAAPAHPAPTQHAPAAPAFPAGPATLPAMPAQPVTVQPVTVGPAAPVHPTTVQHEHYMPVYPAPAAPEIRTVAMPVRA